MPDQELKFVEKDNKRDALIQKIPALVKEHKIINRLHLENLISQTDEFKALVSDEIESAKEQFNEPEGERKAAMFIMFKKYAYIVDDAVSKGLIKEVLLTINGSFDDVQGFNLCAAYVPPDVKNLLVFLTCGNDEYEADLSVDLEAAGKIIKEES